MGENGAEGSEMALAVLMFTSVGTTEKDPHVRVDDSIGPRLIRKKGDGKYVVGRKKRWHPLFRRMVERSDPGTYGFMLARLHHMDEIVRREAAEGLDQLVILGAGYDTRAYRMREELAGARVFEVDLPGTSRDKRERLEEVLGAAPDDVSYVEVDFNSQNFRDRLLEHGYDDSGRTLFVLSGVSMYLPATAVLELFSRVAESRGGRTSIVFDYFFDDVTTAPERYHGARQWITRATKSGEEPRYGVAMDHLGAVLSNSGLRLDSQYDMADLADRHLRRANGTSVERPYDFAAVAHAYVAS